MQRFKCLTRSGKSVPFQQRRVRKHGSPELLSKAGVLPRYGELLRIAGGRAKRARARAEHASSVLQAMAEPIPGRTGKEKRG